MVERWATTEVLNPIDHRWQCM